MMTTFYLLVSYICTGLHVAWLGIVLGGAALAVVGWLYRHPKAEYFYLAIVLASTINRFSGKPCILTTAERYFRTLASGSPSQGYVEVFLQRVHASFLFGFIAFFFSVGLIATLYWHGKQILLEARANREGVSNE